ncbi:MAG TPA: T9SS type A sorting domain-containing protein [Candidatus Eisenbacteria bacterium]|uniref:T9SS type A sorting domain-containing protein n=1 Tax=Eiseniibacteriota bacterium TaxID=2212470 RepID=A0A7V2AUN0_UNCEI|nr:T9SS type A sorting domain-containing protein [Candidatus Eisenbacteria bacterium]
MRTLVYMMIAAATIAALPPAARAQHVVAPGSTGNVLNLDIENSSDLLSFKGGNAEVAGWSGIVTMVNPPVQPVSPADLPPGGSGSALFTFDVDASAAAGDLGYIDIWLTTLTGDSALVEVELAAGAVTGAVTDFTPRVAVLYQNYPNPFNPSTSIEFSLPARERVSLKVFDVSGRLVRTLVDGPLPDGNHRYAWDGRNERGAAVASGVYFYVLRSESIRQARKAVLLR